MSAVLDALSRHASEHPNATALTDDRATLSYKALWLHTQEWAASLDAVLQRTATIGSCLENSVLWVLLDLALITLRMPSVPIPPFFTDAQRRHALTQSGASVLLA